MTGGQEASHTFTRKTNHMAHTHSARLHRQHNGKKKKSIIIIKKKKEKEKEKGKREKKSYCHDVQNS